jgi:predicted metalloprotease
VRISLIAASVCMVAGLAVSGTAHAETTVAQARAVPPAVLTKNKIYRSGTASAQRCSVPSIRPGSVASLKTFHRAMAACANRFWAARFKAAGLSYRAPKIAVTTGSASVCGKITSNGAQYCPLQHTIAIRIMRRDLRDPFRMNIAHSVAHEWGHHVQELTGILDEQNREYWRAGGSARTTLSHRLEMQAECFAGVFYSSTLDSIDPGITWEQWVGAVGKADESKIHGRPRNLAYWQNRGYTGGSARSCDTWSAPRSRVS